MRTLEASPVLIPAPATPERVKVIVIGAGQAGLSAGYHLAKQRIPFLILDAHKRVGDVWRARWDSLKLFTPAQLCGLDGLPFPAPAGTFPSKDAMADYLEAYAERFKLPVRSGVRVESVERVGDRYVIAAGAQRFEAEHVVVAMANYQEPRLPAFAAELDPAIVQMHSLAYRNPRQLRDGPVLLVGAGNSGAEIALELSKRHEIVLAGEDVGDVPFDTVSWFGRRIMVRVVMRFIFHRLLTRDTPIGRKANQEHKPTPLIRTKSRDLAAAGVMRAPRVVGAKDGKPLLADGRMLDVTNIVWCTGFRSAFDWIHAPVFDDNGEPKQTRGVAAGEPGLYFIGLHFLYAFSSSMIHGVGRDARYVAETIAQRVRAPAHTMFV